MTTNPEVLALAVQHHQTGDFARAEQIYRQILQANPTDANALNLLGLLAGQVGQPETALELIRQAVSILPQVAEFHANLAGVYLALERFDDALASYREALRLRPDLPFLHQSLGDVLKELGRFPEAEASYRSALRFQPDNAEGLVKLGILMAQQRKSEEAQAAFREALRFRPGDASLLNFLGAALAEQGQFDQAVVRFQEALRSRPEFPEAFYNLALARERQGRLPEAEASYRDALRLQPNYAEAHYNAGNVLKKMGRLSEAQARYQEVLRLEPDHADAHADLGAVLVERGCFAEAVARFQTALRLRPNQVGTLLNLGLALTALERYDEALVCLEQVLRIQPGDSAALGGMANIYFGQGRIDEAIAGFRQVIAARPELLSIQSTVLFAQNCQAQYQPEVAFAEHLRWGTQFARLAKEHLPAHGSRNDPARRLRLGYVSADFRNQVIGNWLEAILDARDRSSFEVFSYANQTRGDAVTGRLQTLSDHWRNIATLSDAHVADLISQDEIDVLIDLSGHTAGNRLGVFARRPAPIQVSYLGYPGSTGLPAINYRLTDAHCDPPGQTERFHCEKLVRLPEVWWCYVSRSDLEPGPLPARRSGEVTFGSVNALHKVTDEIICVWSQLLRELPGSRLILMAGMGTGGDERVRAAFASHGVECERVTLLGRCSLADYFRLYQTIDLALDTFPLTGCNTTADALWMGVPTVTRAGPSYLTRQGLAILTHVGLEELVTDTYVAYVEAASRLARDLPRLRELRAKLRERLEQSPLMDVPRFTRNLETAYRTMWQQFR